MPSGRGRNRTVVPGHATGGRTRNKKTRFLWPTENLALLCPIFLLKCQCRSESAQNHFIYIFFMAEELFSLVSSNFTA